MMKEYGTPKIEEEEIELEDVIALSQGDGSNPDNDPFFSN